MHSRQLGPICTVLETSGNLGTISERCPPQPFAPQVLQTGRKCQGNMTFAPWEVLTLYVRVQCGRWTILNITRRGTPRETTSGQGLHLFCCSPRHYICPAPVRGAQNDHKKSACSHPSTLCTPHCIMQTPGPLWPAQVSLSLREVSIIRILKFLM